jgi:hypothetical protein
VTIQSLKICVNRLLDPSRSIDALEYLKQVSATKQAALDELNRDGLSRNPVYSAIERLIFSPSLSPYDLRRTQLTLARAHCSPGLRFLKHRLELAQKLLRRHRQKNRPNPSFRLPVREADSKGRAKTVARIIERLHLFNATSDGQDYERLKQQDSGFAAALETVWRRPKLEAQLTELVNYRAKKQMAVRFAADYHEKELSTIQTDWKHNKPPKFRRQH